MKKRTIIVLLIIGLVFISQVGVPTRAQQSDDPWTTPVNLSRSGAANNAKVYTASDGKQQAIWVDRFDGLVSAVNLGAGWSEPRSVSLPVDPDTVLGIPEIIVDRSGIFHAFWYGTEDGEGGPLFHSAMLFGDFEWTFPDLAADAAFGFKVVPYAGLGVFLAYMRTEHSSFLPAGMYVRRWVDGWGNPDLVYSSIYFRLLRQEDAYIDIRNVNDLEFHLIFADARQGVYLHSYSDTQGVFWTSPQPIAQINSGRSDPRTVALPDGQLLRIWEEIGLNECRIYQQELLSPDADSTELANWSPPKIVLNISPTCPQEDMFAPLGEDLLWLWGLHSSTLSLSVWSRAGSSWTEPAEISFSFTEEAEEGAQFITLSDLDTSIRGDEIIVVGTDVLNGEIWSLEGRIDPSQLLQANLSIWEDPVKLSPENVAVTSASLVIDNNNGVHLVWAESEPNQALIYMGFQGDSSEFIQGLSRKVTVVQDDSGEIIVRHPSIAIDDSNILHLVWSGAENGQILYRRVEANLAAFAQNWSPTLQLSDQMGSSRPQIGTDQEGNLFVLYAVPVNNGRGVYLVRSLDGGDTWLEPTLLFDAQAENWAMVDQPTMAVSANGTLYFAWLRREVPGDWLARGVYFSIVPAGEDQAMPAEIVMQSNMDWPRLVVSDSDLLLVAQDANSKFQWYRRASRQAVGTNALRWDPTDLVPNWPPIEGPVGIVSDREGTAHIAGMSTSIDQLVYSVWVDRAWSEVESLPLGEALQSNVDGVAYSPPQGGKFGLAIVVSTEGDEGRPALFYTARNIPQIEKALVLEANAEVTEVAGGEVAEVEQPGQETQSPLSEIDFSQIPAPPTTSISPLIIALTPVILIVGAVIVRFVWRRSR